MQMETTRKRGSNTHIRQNRLQIKAITKDKEGHYKGITGAPEYIKQILSDREKLIVIQ